MKEKEMIFGLRAVIEAAQAGKDIAIKILLTRTIILNLSLKQRVHKCFTTVCI